MLARMLGPSFQTAGFQRSVKRGDPSRTDDDPSLRMDMCWHEVAGETIRAVQDIPPRRLVPVRNALSSSGAGGVPHNDPVLYGCVKSTVMCGFLADTEPVV